MGLDLGHWIRRVRRAYRSCNAIPADPLDCGRAPIYGRRLPAVIGAGGWPIEEPTMEEMKVFLDCLRSAMREAPQCFGSAHMDGDDYTAVINTHEWLELLVRERMLFGTG